MGREIPLHERIELAEAFVALAWEQIKNIPASRGGAIADHRYQVEKAANMIRVDAMLDAMLGMYDLRILQTAAESEAS